MIQISYGMVLKLLHEIKRRQASPIIDMKPYGLTLEKVEFGKVRMKNYL